MFDMFDDDDKKKDDKKKPPGGFNIPTFTWVAWIAIIGSIVALMLVKQYKSAAPGVTMSEAEFLSKFDSNQISHATITYNSSMAGSPITIAGTFLQTDKNGKQIQSDFVAPNVDFADLSPATREEIAEV